MAKAYWISSYRSVSNPEALAAYAKLAGPALTAAEIDVLDLPLTEAIALFATL